MAKGTKIAMDEKINAKSDTFMENVNSEMYYKSEFTNNSMSFNWVDEIEFTCPYIDNIIRNPKLALINEEDVVKIGKAKKISVASVKDLSRHTHYIDKIDEKTNEVQPSKILIIRREETYNTYENRFIYTLIKNTIRFLAQKEALLEDLEAKNSKTLEYAASTTTGNERVNIELKISANELPEEQKGNEFENEIDKIKARIKKINDYINNWRRNEFMTSLEKAHVALIFPPIRKTNTILKNPNFQIAMKLWEFLQNYDEKATGDSKEGLDTSGDNVLKGILEDSFLMDYYVLDSISLSKREQKEKLCKYAFEIINRQVQRAISILLNNGVDISENEIINMISFEIKNEKNKRLVDSTDVKNKFKTAMDQYLERAQGDWYDKN